MNVKIDPRQITPEQLAELFWDFDSRQQAAFFNHLGVISLATLSPFERKPGSWFTLDWQMYHASVDHPALPLSRRVMEIIGNAASGSCMMPYDRDATREQELTTRQ